MGRRRWRARRAPLDDRGPEVKLAVLDQQLRVVALCEVLKHGPCVARLDVNFVEGLDRSDWGGYFCNPRGRCDRLDYLFGCLTSGEVRINASRVGQTEARFFAALEHGHRPIAQELGVDRLNPAVEHRVARQVEVAEPDCDIKAGLVAR